MQEAIIIEESLLTRMVGTPVHVAAQMAAQSGVAPGPAYVEAIAPSVNAAVNAVYAAIESNYYQYKQGDTVLLHVIDEYFFSDRYADAFKQEFCRKVRVCVCVVKKQRK